MDRSGSMNQTYIPDKISSKFSWRRTPLNFLYSMRIRTNHSVQNPEQENVRILQENHPGFIPPAPSESTSYTLNSLQLGRLLEAFRIRQENCSGSDSDFDSELYADCKSALPSPAPVILCIGTDRIIGDSLGPLTGSLLEKRAGNSLIIYGTLNATVHACNLTATLLTIKKKHPGSPVIAVDASLGTDYKAGSVLIRPGSLKPGMGVQKNLPDAGDISITGIAGASGKEPYLTLQTARLSLIMEMAERICECILEVCG